MVEDVAADTASGFKYSATSMEKRGCRAVAAVALWGQLWGLPRRGVAVVNEFQRGVVVVSCSLLLFFDSWLTGKVEVERE